MCTCAGAASASSAVAGRAFSVTGALTSRHVHVRVRVHEHVHEHVHGHVHVDAHAHEHVHEHVRVAGALTPMDIVEARTAAAARSRRGVDAQAEVLPL